VLPFVERKVPFVVNNNGRLSENAPALLFENCLERGTPGPNDPFKPVAIWRFPEQTPPIRAEAYQGNGIFI
jgi:hypothetical protein